MFDAQVVTHKKFLAGALVECSRKNEGFEIIYCLDYDVIFAFLRPDIVGTRYTAAVRYLLENTKNRIAIPPGTFCSLLNFIEQSNRKYAEYCTLGRRLGADSHMRTAVDTVLRLQGRSRKALAYSAIDLARRDRSLLDIVKPEMIRSALASHYQLQSLVDILQKDNRFAGVLLPPDDSESEAICSLAGDISRTGQYRTLKPMNNTFAAMNILSICRARATENELYLGRRRHASDTAIPHLELITNTPSLFRLTIDADLARDEFCARECPDVEIPHNTLMATPWEVMYRAICQHGCDVDAALARVTEAMGVCDDVLKKIRRKRSIRAIQQRLASRHETDLERVLLALKIEERFDRPVVDRLVETFDAYVHEPILAEIEQILLQDISVDAMKNRQYPLPGASSEFGFELVQTSDKLRKSILTLQDLLLNAPALGPGASRGEAMDVVRTGEMTFQKWARVDIPEDAEGECFQLRRELPGTTGGILLTVDIYDDRYAVHWETTQTIEDIRRCFQELRSTQPEVSLLFEVKTGARKAIVGSGASVTCGHETTPRQIYSAVRRGPEGVGWGRRKSLGAYRPALRSVSVPLRGALVIIETVSKYRVPREICVVARSDFSQAIAELYLRTSNTFSLRSVLATRLGCLFEEHGFGGTA